MDIAYINEETAIVWPDAVEDRTPYDIRQVVADMAAIRTMRDLVGFMLKTPASFFDEFLRSLGDYHLSYYLMYGRDCSEGCLPVHAHGGGKDAYHMFRRSVADAVDKDFDDVAFLDGVVAKCGELGTCIDIGEGHFEIVPKDDFYCLSIRSIESAIQNAQSLLKLAAIANGDSPTGGLKRLDVECDAPFPVQFIDPGFVYHPEIVDDSVLRHQCSDLRDYGDYSSDTNRVFPYEGLQSVERAVYSFLHTDGAHGWHGRRYPFVYPADMKDREMAARAFVTFTECMFAMNCSSGISMGTFRVGHDQEGFHVVDIPEPLHDALRQITTLAAEDSIRLCSHCGKNPVLTDRSRGVGAAYCSKSCKTMASKERRDQAYMMAAKGVPVNEAIERIGSSHEASVMRWYAEAEDLL